MHDERHQARAREDGPDDPVEVARALLAAGRIPSRNSAFARYAEPGFARGVRLARRLRDLSTAIAAMRTRGLEPEIAEAGDVFTVKTTTTTRAGPVMRTTGLAGPELALLLELLARPAAAKRPADEAPSLEIAPARP